MSSDDELTSHNDAGEWGRTVAKVMSEIGDEIADESRSAVAETLLRYRFQFHDAGVADRRSARRDAEKLIAAARGENQRKRQELQDEFSRVARRLRRELLDLPGEMMEVPESALDPERPAGDVVVELLRLISQAGQTARVRSVRELAALEDRRVGLVLDLDDTVAAVESTRSQIKSARAELEACQVALAESQRDVADTANQRDHVSAEYNELTEQVESARVELENSLRELESLGEQQDQAATRLSSLVLELAETEADMEVALALQDSLNSEVNALESRREEARRERDELNAERTETQSALDQLQAEVASTEARLEGVQADVSAAAEEERLLQHKLGELNDEMAGTEANSRTLTEELIELKARRDGLSIDITEAELKLSQLQQSFADTESSMNEARSDLSELNLERSALDVEMNTRRDELNRVEQRLESTATSFQKTLADRDAVANEYDSLMMELHQLRHRREEFLMPAHDGDPLDPQPGLMVLASVIERDHAAAEERDATPRPEAAHVERTEFGGFTRAASAEIDDVFDATSADTSFEDDGFDKRFASILDDSEEV